MASLWKRQCCDSVSGRLKSGFQQLLIDTDRHLFCPCRKGTVLPSGNTPKRSIYRYSSGSRRQLIQVEKLRLSWLPTQLDVAHRPVAMFSNNNIRCLWLMGRLRTGNRWLLIPVDEHTTSESASSAPLSRKSDNCGTLMARLSTARDSWASTGTVSSFALALSPRLISAISCSRF